jgi:hypothetical protein
MPPFVPPEPPIEPDAPEPPPSLETPEPPPIVGLGSPWAPIDAENRDRILDWWRMWFRRVFFPWIAAWVAYWAAQWARIVAYLNEWLEYAGEYIEEHAVAGYSWRRTDDTIVPEATTLVEILTDPDIRPLLVGEYVSDTTRDVNYGVIVTVVDESHAEVEWVGSLLGLPGYGWWSTDTEIADTGTTAVVLDAVAGREPQVNDLVVSTGESDNYGRITIVTDPTHVTVEYLGSLRGPAGVADLGSITLATGELGPLGDPTDTYQGPIAFPQMVGAYFLSTTSRCWVRVYASEAYMIADEGRDILTPLNIADDHGCFLDFVSIPGELSKVLTPGIMFSDIGLGLWLSVQNRDALDPADITLHFDFRIFRE